MIIKSTKQLEQYKKAADISTKILKELRMSIKVGLTSLELDHLADQLCSKYQVAPNFKGQGNPGNVYQHATCISVNDTVLHGVPNNRPFKKYDVVKVDFGIEYQGLNTDHCFTVSVAGVTPQDKQLIEFSRKTIIRALSQAIAGNRTGSIGQVLESATHKSKYTVIKQFCGHGIGLTLHDKPQIPSYGNTNTGETLLEGQVLCIEAQYVTGSDKLYVGDDQWSVSTVDGGKSAMFEYMVVVGKKKPLVLTPTMDWPIVTSG